MANVQAQTGLTAPLAGSGLLRPLAENWWLLLLRGIAALAFGTLTFVWPGITLLTLTLLWGAYALADGVLALWAAASGNTSDVGAALVAGRGGHRQRGCRRADILVARHDRPGAAILHRQLGDRYRRDADLGRDPLAQGDRG